MHRVYRVSFDPGASPSLGRPEPLFDLPADAFRISTDPRGDGFLMSMHERVEESDVVESHRGIRVIQNWTRTIEDS